MSNTTKLVEYIKTQLKHYDIPENEIDGVFSDVYKRILESKAIGTFKGSNLPRQRSIAVAGKKKDSTKIRSRATERTRIHLNDMLDDVYDNLKKSVSKYRSDRVKLKKDPSFKAMTRTQLRQEMSSMFKDAYTRAYILGLEGGGLKDVTTPSEMELTDNEKKWIQSAFSHEMRFFRKFFQDIVDTDYSIEKVNNRLNDYITTIYSIYEAGRVKAIPENVLIYWVLHPAEHCPDCIQLNKLSPYTRDTLPTTPKGGSTRCIQNCKCTLRYVKASDKKVDQVRKRNKKISTVLGMLRK